MAHSPYPSPDKLALLRGVSRSFYLSIRLLPPPLREPIGLAYLLARATDTIADTTDIPAGQRQEQLATLARAIDNTSATPEANAPSMAALIESFAPHQADPHERHLIEALPLCLGWLHQLQPADQADVRTVLRHITRGQALDVQRFAAGTPVQALANAAELDEYTYLVAGCVGEFWTALCLRHLPDFARLPAAQLMQLGRGYGMGLQLINILRDAGQDLASGRCYFPADALAAAGVSPHELQAQPQALEGIYQHWLDRASQNIAMGMAYADAVNSRRVRAASALPALIGARTLALLRAQGTGALYTRVKVPRHEVRAILLRLAINLAGRPALAAQFDRLARRNTSAPMGQSGA